MGLPRGKTLSLQTLRYPCWNVSKLGRAFEWNISLAFPGGKRKQFPWKLSSKASPTSFDRPTREVSTCFNFTFQEIFHFLGKKYAIMRVTWVGFKTVLKLLLLLASFFSPSMEKGCCRMCRTRVAVLPGDANYWTALGIDEILLISTLESGVDIWNGRERQVAVWSCARCGGGILQWVGCCWMCCVFLGDRWDDVIPVI